MSDDRLVSVRSGRQQEAWFIDNNKANGLGESKSIGGWRERGGGMWEERKETEIERLIGGSEIRVSPSEQFGLKSPI